MLTALRGARSEGEASVCGIVVDLAETFLRADVGVVLGYYLLLPVAVAWRVGVGVVGVVMKDGARGRREETIATLDRQESRKKS